MIHSFDKRSWLALLLVCASALPARAQLAVGAGLGAAVQRETSNPWQSVSRFEPAMRLDSRWLQMNGVASLLSGTSQLMHLDSGAVGFVAAPPALGVFRLTTTGTVARQVASPTLQRTTGTLESALSARLGNWGAWFGYASSQTREINTESNKPQMRMGLWKQIGGVTVSLSRDGSAVIVPGGKITTRIDSTKDSVSMTSDTSRSRSVGWNTVQGRVGWGIGNVYFDTRFGIQPKVGNSPQALWGRASAAVALTSRLSLVAEGGNQPISPSLNLPAKKFASLGLRVSPAALLHPEGSPHVRPVAANFALQSIGNQEFVVRMRVPSARVVEVSGDFNGWKPVALRQTQPDVWETTLTLRAGTYHMNVRVNGDSWTAPPGLPSTTDDFNGTVGLVVVR